MTQLLRDNRGPKLSVSSALTRLGPSAKSSSLMMSKQVVQAGGQEPAKMLPKSAAKDIRVEEAGEGS